MGDNTPETNQVTLEIKTLSPPRFYSHAPRQFLAIPHIQPVFFSRDRPEAKKHKNAVCDAHCLCGSSHRLRHRFRFGDN